MLGQISEYDQVNLFEGIGLLVGHLSHKKDTAVLEEQARYMEVIHAFSSLLPSHLRKSSLPL